MSSLIKVNSDEIPRDAWNLYETALVDEKAGRKSDAKEKYEKAVEIFPRFDAAWLNLAMVYQDLGDSSMPIVISKQGLEHVPDSSLLWSNLGTFYIKKIMHFKGIEAFQKALEYDSNNYTAALNLSSTLRLVEKSQEAEKVICTILDKPLEESLSANTRVSLAKLWAQLALIRVEIGKTEQVREACERALEMDTTNPTATEILSRVQVWEIKSEADRLYEIALAIDRQKDFTKAIEAYERVLSVDPSHIHTRINLGAVFVDQNRYEEGAKILRSVVEEDASYHIAWINLGKAFVGLGIDDDAEVAFKRCIEIQSDYANAWYQLACVYDRQNKLNEAETALQKTVEHNPEHYAAWCDLGITLIQLGRKQDAERPLKAATEFGPDDILSWINLGLYYITNNRCNEAKTAIDAAGRIDPENGKLQQLIAMWNQECG